LQMISIKISLGKIEKSLIIISFNINSPFNFFY